MPIEKLIPDLPAVVRECVVVIIGAVLAAAIVGQFPALKQWMKEQWQP